MLEVCDVCHDPKSDTSLLPCLHIVCEACREDVIRHGAADGDFYDEHGRIVHARRCPACCLHVELPSRPQRIDDFCTAHSAAMDVLCAGCVKVVCPQCRCRCADTPKLLSITGLKDEICSERHCVDAAAKHLTALLAELWRLRGRHEESLRKDQAELQQLLEFVEFVRCCHVRRALQEHCERLRATLTEAVNADLKLIELDVAAAEALQQSLAQAQIRLACVSASTACGLADLGFLWHHARQHCERALHLGVSATHTSFLCVVKPLTREGIACAFIGRTFALRLSNFHREYSKIVLDRNTLYQPNIQCIDELPDGDLLVVDKNNQITRRDRTLQRVLETWHDIAGKRVCVCPSGTVWVIDEHGCLVHATAHGESLRVLPADNFAFEEVVVTRTGQVLAYQPDVGQVQAFFPNGDPKFTIMSRREPFDAVYIVVGESAFALAAENGFYELYDIARGIAVPAGSRGPRPHPHLRRLFTVPGHTTLYQATLHSTLKPRRANACFDWLVPPGSEHLAFWHKTCAAGALLHTGAVVLKSFFWFKILRQIECTAAIF